MINITIQISNPSKIENIILHNQLSLLLNYFHLSKWGMNHQFLINCVAKQMKELSKVSLPTAQVSSQYFAAKGMVSLTNTNLTTKLTKPSSIIALI